MIIQPVVVVALMASFCCKQADCVTSIEYVTHAVVVCDHVGHSQQCRLAMYSAAGKPNQQDHSIYKTHP